MASDTDKNSTLFGDLDEPTRRAVMDVLGRTLVAARDLAIVQWDQILQGSRHYAPWERAIQTFPDLDDRTRDIIRHVAPIIVDTFLYCLLAELDATREVTVSVALHDEIFADVARKSWGLAAEPTGESGWLARFSKQRFEQPY